MMFIVLYITIGIMSVIYGDSQLEVNTLEEGGIFAFILVVVLWVVYVPVMLIYDIVDVLLWILDKVLPRGDD